MTNVRHLRGLQAFNAAASHLNLSKAAAELGVTHGAVSRQIKQLEQYLGVTLFHRLSSGVQLTDAGERLHQATRKAFGVLEQGIGATKRDQRRGSLTISLSSSLAIKWMVPKLQEFRQAHPGISIRLDTDEQVVDFDESDVDVALRYASDPSHGLFSQCLLQERLVVVAAPALAPKHPATQADIKSLPLLHDQFHPYWDDWAACAGLSAPDLQAKSAVFPDSAVLVAAAIDGLGAILVRHVLVADDLKAGRLAYLSDVSLDQGRSLNLVCREGDERSPAIRALRLWLVQKCSDL